MAKLTLVTSLTKIGLVLTALSIGVTTSGSASAATVLLQDNFDDENGGLRELNYDNFANWNVTDGTVDIVAKNQFFPEGKGIIVDLDGSAIRSL